MYLQRIKRRHCRSWFHVRVLIRYINTRSISRVKSIQVINSRIRLEAILAATRGLFEELCYQEMITWWPRSALTQLRFGILISARTKKGLRSLWSEIFNKPMFLVSWFCQETSISWWGRKKVTFCYTTWLKLHFASRSKEHTRRKFGNWLCTAALR